MTENDQLIAALDQETELPDVRPSNGEYVYHDGDFASIPRYISNAVCFVCGHTGNDVWRHFSLVVQCIASGVRINEMFTPYPCPEPKWYDHGSAHLIVSVCEKHQHNAVILRHLTKNGVIIPEHIALARRSAIGHEEFERRTKERAFAIWWQKEGERRCCDWVNALVLCIRELGHIPSFNERRARAECLCEERKKAGQALEDWLQAEKEIREQFTVE